MAGAAVGAALAADGAAGMVAAGMVAVGTAAVGAGMAAVTVGAERGGKGKHTMRHTTIRVLALVLAASPLAAHGAGAATAPPQQTEQQAADQRIQTLQAALQITPPQMAQWNSFAAAMRDNAAATDALFRNRAAGAATMNALDNMKSYAAVARSYADNTQKLSDAFGTLYAALSDQQKQVADRLFRQQAEHQTATK